MKQLHNAQDAIGQANEGGYKDTSLWIRSNPIYALTDPLFWIALGKARGWDEEPIGTPDGGYANNSWESVALDWFLNRLSNGEETKFWESLP